MTTTAVRDFTAEYLAARHAVWAATTHADRTVAEDAAMAILDQADEAGSNLYLHVLDLDAIARLAPVTKEA